MAAGPEQRLVLERKKQAAQTGKGGSPLEPELRTMRFAPLPTTSGYGMHRTVSCRSAARCVIGTHVCICRLGDGSRTASALHCAYAAATIYIYFFFSFPCGLACPWIYIPSHPSSSLETRKRRQRRHDLTFSARDVPRRPVYSTARHANIGQY